MAFTKWKAIWVWTGFTAAVWISFIVCRIVTGGSCPAVELDASFDRTAYLGRWYEMFRDSTIPFE